MSEQTERFDWIRKLSRITLIASIGLVTLLAVATLIPMGLAILQPSAVAKFLMLPDPWMVFPCLLIALVAEMAAALLLFLGYGVVQLLVAGESHAYRSSVMISRLERIESLMADSGGVHDNLQELATLSDKAKSLLYREKEILAVREAVHHDLMRQQYASAEAMIDSIENDLGYTEEAQRLRQEVVQSRDATIDEKIDAAINRIMSLLDEQQWIRAGRETSRILKLFPENEKIAALPSRIVDAKTAYKKRLLQEYGEAVRKNDIDRGMELLRELDRYLTPEEGAALQESARGVFKARLRQLGVQFAISVNDQKWEEAVSAGEEIIREFPNSRMAQEVRGKLDAMKAKTHK
jgi:tetratricopeptide (TPR) repeat protein